MLFLVLLLLMLERVLLMLVLVLLLLVVLLLVALLLVMLLLLLLLLLTLALLILALMLLVLPYLLHVVGRSRARRIHPVRLGGRGRKPSGRRNFSPRGSVTGGVRVRRERAGCCRGSGGLVVSLRLVLLLRVRSSNSTPASTSRSIPYGRIGVRACVRAGGWVGWWAVARVGGLG